MTQQTTTITLRDFNNRECCSGITYLWVAGVGCPAGREYRHNPDADGDDWCDFAEFDLLERLWGLPGTIDGSTWCWTGEGSPTDEYGNTIYNVNAR